MLEHIIVFLLMFLFDTLYTKYLIHIENREAFKAAISSAFMYLFNSYIILKFVEDTQFIWPAVVGGFLGTYHTISRNNRENT